MRPRFGRSNPTMVFRSVDLPAPFGPTTVTSLAMGDADAEPVEDIDLARVAGDDVLRREHDGHDAAPAELPPR